MSGRKESQQFHVTSSFIASLRYLGRQIDDADFTRAAGLWQIQAGKSLLDKFILSTAGYHGLLADLATASKKDEFEQFLSQNFELPPALIAKQAKWMFESLNNHKLAVHRQKFEDLLKKSLPRMRRSKSPSPVKSRQDQSRDSTSRQARKRR